MQIVHKSLLVARKGLPGHYIYNKLRNAAELEELYQLRHGADAQVAIATQSELYTPNDKEVSTVQGEPATPKMTKDVELANVTIDVEPEAGPD